MALKPIISYPNSLLRQRSTQVEKFDQEFQTLVDDLVDTMLEHRSMGLAAPQIGELKRVFVLNRKRILGDKTIEIKPKDILCITNPEIISQKSLIDSEEGCLSIQGQRGVVKRFNQIMLSALDRESHTFSLTADGMLSIVIQHETDHLDGILLIDKLLPLFSNEASPKKGRGQMADGSYVRGLNVCPMPLGSRAPNFSYEKQKNMYFAPA